MKIFLAMVLFSFFSVLSPISLACPGGGIDITLPSGNVVHMDARMNGEYEGYQVIFRGWVVTMIAPDGKVYQSRVVSVAKGMDNCVPSRTTPPTPITPIPTM